MQPPQPQPKTSIIHISEHLYHQKPNRDAKMLQTKFSYAVQSEYDPIIESRIIGQDWMPLLLNPLPNDFQVSEVLICNLYPRWKANPTKEERDRADKAILFVSFRPGDFTGPDAIVIPGRSLRVPRPSIHNWRICCAEGPCEITYGLLPL